MQTFLAKHIFVEENKNKIERDVLRGENFSQA